MRDGWSRGQTDRKWETERVGTHTEGERNRERESERKRRNKRDNEERGED